MEVNEGGKTKIWSGSSTTFQRHIDRFRRNKVSKGDYEDDFRAQHPWATRVLLVRYRPLLTLGSLGMRLGTTHPSMTGSLIVSHGMRSNPDDCQG